MVKINSLLFFEKWVKIKNVDISRVSGIVALGEEYKLKKGKCYFLKKIKNNVDKIKDN